ncbi:MAG TPA: YihY/virulence factor BrkB family protein [Gemmatimonadaceae bacterium]|nr:YihY/virulence factor BrkB family protein [Gemmatimonadaceae bacterium]
MTLKGYDVGVLLKATVREAWKDNLLGLSAQAAYSFFFSLFPILLFLAPLFSLIGNKQEVVNRILTRISVALPAEAYTMLRNVVKDVVFSQNAPGLISIGILLAAFSGSAVIDTLMGALNAAYGVHDPRPWWRKRFIAIGFTAAAGIVVSFATIVMVAGEGLVDFIAGIVRIRGDTARLWEVVQYPVALVVLIGFIWLLFYFLPYAKQKKSHVLVGSIFTLSLWIVITLAFRYYVANFASYNKTYGTIGGVIILLTWMYWTMLALLVGGELNAELCAGTGRPDAALPKQPSEAIRDAAIAESARF